MFGLVLQKIKVIVCYPVAKCNRNAVSVQGCKLYWSYTVPTLMPYFYRAKAIAMLLSKQYRTIAIAFAQWK